MDKIWEYRIEYRDKGSTDPGRAALPRTSHHYYNAESAIEAFNYHKFMADKKSWDIDVLKVERNCPYSNKWIDETDLITPKLSERQMDTLLDEVREQFGSQND